MIEIHAQWTGKMYAPFSIEDRDASKAFKPNQVVTLKVTGTKRPRSVQQNRWAHAIFRIVASNTEDPDWDTPEKVKRNVKMAMKFFKDDVIVHGNKVFFELRSFAFDKMDQNEADVKYEEAKNICAKKLGVKSEALETEAMQESF